MTPLDARAREFLLSQLADANNSPQAAARHMERAGFGSRRRCLALVTQALREEAELAARQVIDAN